MQSGAALRVGRSTAHARSQSHVGGDGVLDPRHERRHERVDAGEAGPRAPVPGRHDPDEQPATVRRVVVHHRASRVVLHVPHADRQPHRQYQPAASVTGSLSEA